MSKKCAISRLESSSLLIASADWMQREAQFFIIFFLKKFPFTKLFGIIISYHQIYEILHEKKKPHPERNAG